MENENNFTKSIKDDILTIEQLSCYLKVHRSTISRLIKSKELPSFHLGSRVLVHKVQLSKFIEKRIADGIGQSLGDN